MASAGIATWTLRVQSIKLTETAVGLHWMRRLASAMANFAPVVDLNRTWGFHNICYVPAMVNLFKKKNTGIKYDVWREIYVQLHIMYLVLMTNLRRWKRGEGENYNWCCLSHIFCIFTGEGESFLKRLQRERNEYLDGGERLFGG